MKFPISHSIVIVTLIFARGALALDTQEDTAIRALGDQATEADLYSRGANIDLVERDVLEELAEREPLLFGAIAKIGFKVGKYLYNKHHRREETTPGEDIVARYFEERGFDDGNFGELTERDLAFVEMIMRNSDADLTERAIDEIELSERDPDELEEVDLRNVEDDVVERASMDPVTSLVDELD